MELRKVETTVTPELNDIGVAIKVLIVEAKKAVAGGADAGKIAQIAVANFQTLMIALQGIEKVPAEVLQCPYAAGRGVIVPVLEGLEEAFKKEVAVAVAAV